MDHWKPIDECEPRGIESYILWNGKCVFTGWLNDDGWHDDKNADHMDEPEHPQPTHFMPFPEPPA